MYSQKINTLLNHPASASHSDFVVKCLLLEDIYKITYLMYLRAKEIFGNRFDNELLKQKEEFHLEVTEFCKDKNLFKFEELENVPLESNKDLIQKIERSKFQGIICHWENFF